MGATRPCAGAAAPRPGTRWEHAVTKRTGGWTGTRCGCDDRGRSRRELLDVRMTTMKCPVCLQPDLVMSDRQGIEIDYCPQCRGVWLDRGELDKIIERSAAPPPAQQPYAPQTPPPGYTP